MLKLLLLQARVSLQQLLIYRLASVMVIVFGVSVVFAEYLAIEVYYDFGESIGGWSEGAFFILFGSFNCMIFLYDFLFEIGHDEFAFKVKYGELDYDLIRPVDSMLLCSLSRFNYASLLNLFLPIYFIWIGTEGEGIQFGVFKLFGFITAICVGTFVFYLINHAVMILTFWLTDISNAFQLIFVLGQLGSKPLKLYPMTLQVVFGFCIPIILAGNFPAEVALGMVSIDKIAALFFGTGVLFLLVRYFWQCGLKKYASASS